MTPQEKLQMELLKTDLWYERCISIVLALALSVVLVVEIIDGLVQ